MFQYIEIALVMLVFAGPAQAHVLAPINESAATPLPIELDQPLVPCDKIIERLTKYNSMAREHDQSVAGFLSEVVTKVSGWYDVLSPLEGTSQNLEPGTFLPLQDGAAKISRVSDLAYQNADLLANEMDRLIQSLGQCRLVHRK